MTSRFMLSALIVVASLGPALHAQENEQRPGLKISPDCALAKGERPRLLFRGRDLAKYKARVAGPMKEDFDRFKAYWDDKLAKKEKCDILCLGVLYQLTGDKRYADAVRDTKEFKRGEGFYQYPFTLDLIFDALTPEEVRLHVGLFLKDADQRFVWGRKQHALWTAIALYGADDARQAEIEKWLAIGYRAAKEQIAECNRWAPNRGGDYNSFSYIGNHTVIHMGGHMLALANALDEDSWGECPWARNLGAYYVYHFFPWRNAAIHFCNTTGLHMGPHNGSLGAVYCLAAAPARYRDGLMQWWTYHVLVYQDPNLKDWPKIAREIEVMEGLWGRILFYDPDLPMLEPKDFPPSRFFPYRGMASMRSDWSQDATLVHFAAGPGEELPDARQNADANTFTIYRKGILALDTGGEHALDASRLQFEPKEDHHNHNYAKQTIAHNGVLVWDPPAGRSPAAGEGPSVKRLPFGGGMTKARPPEWKAARGLKERDPFPLGKALAWETSPEYDYVAGDATFAYDPATLKSFTRQLVYVRPNLVFVFDRVEAAKDGCRTTWLLHAADRPATDGEETPDKRMHPEGHFLWTGSTVTVTDERMGGRMFCQTLLPEKREVRLVGGPFHDFELPDGRNIGPTEATYKSDGLGLSRALGEGVAGWRVEVEDGSGSRSVRFLHVFETCEKDQAKMVPCELVRKDDAVGAKVTLADGPPPAEAGATAREGGTVEVLFRDAGDLGGHVTVTRKDKPAVDRDLATKIEDTYERWKDHPDYDKWMTDQPRRSVILGANP